MSAPPPGPPGPGGPPPGPPPVQGPPPLFDLLQQDPIQGQPQVQQPAPPQPKRQMPDESQIRERITRVTDYWNQRDQRMDQDEKLYKLSTDVSQVSSLGNIGIDAFADGGETVVRNLPYVAVEKLANMLAAEIPVLQMEAPSPDASEPTEILEQGVRFLWDRWGRRYRRTINGSLQRAFGHFLSLRGWASVRIHFDDQLPTGEIPLVLTVVDPRNVYPMPGSTGLRFVVHRQLITFAELVDQFPEAEQIVGADTPDDQAITLEAYYDDFYHCVMADSKMVIPPSAHGYGFVPWSIAIAGGSPIRSTSTDSTSFIADIGPSIFHGTRKTYEQTNRLLSQLATEVARMSNPAKLYYYDPDENDEPQDIDLAPGATNYLIAPKEKVDVIRTSPSPADVQPLLQTLNDDLQRGSLPEVLWGTSNGNPSGFAVSMLTGAARDAAYGVMTGIEQIYEDISEMALKLLLQFQQEPIGISVQDRTGRWVVGHQITPELVNQVGTIVHARFRDMSPRDKIAYAQLAAQLVQAKLLSLKTAREQYLQLDNPNLENEQVLEELIYQDEELVKQYLTPMALAKYSPDLFQAWMARESRRMQQEQQQAALAASMASQPQPGPVVPGLPGPPVPGMPPGPVPAPMGPQPFNALQQAQGAARGPGGAGPLPPGIQIPS